jgi:hypothetical protein
MPEPELISAKELARYRDRFVETLFWRSIASAPEKVPHTKGEPFQVVLTINGVQVPFKEHIEALHNGVSTIAKEYAEEMLRDKMPEITRKLKRIEWRLESLIEMELKGLFDGEEEDTVQVEETNPPVQENTNASQ